MCSVNLIGWIFKVFLYYIYRKDIRTQNFDFGVVEEERGWVNFLGIYEFRVYAHFEAIC